MKKLKPDDLKSIKNLIIESATISATYVFNKLFEHIDFLEHELAGESKEVRAQMQHGRKLEGHIEQKLARAANALEFYAHDGLIDPRPIDSFNDGGRRAREALKFIYGEDL